MSRKKNPIHLLTFLLLFSYSCSEDKKTVNEPMVQEATSHEIIEEEIVIPEDTLETVWAVYQGKLGLYDQQVIMELSITGNDVNGSYFYTKHQKSLELTGVFDSQTNMVQLTESYKGKTTGYLEFNLSRGEINGNWMKKKGHNEKEEFTAMLVNIDKDDYTLNHSRYKNEHQITMYGLEEDNIEQVTDVLNISKIGGGYFTFYYSVIGKNAHMGNIEGFGEIGEDNLGIFRDEETCELEFDFEKNTIEVHETGDCRTYRGYHAYFEGILTLVK